MTIEIASRADGTDRALGVAGIIAGTVLLLGFLGLVVEPPPGTHDVKLVIYCLGAAAVAIGVHRRQASIAPAVVIAVTVAVVLANLWYVVRVLLPYGPWHPFVNDGGAAWLVTGVALWTADAAFGLACAWLANDHAVRRDGTGDRLGACDDRHDPTRPHVRGRPDDLHAAFAHRDRPERCRLDPDRPRRHDGRPAGAQPWIRPRSMKRPKPRRPTN